MTSFVRPDQFRFEFQYRHGKSDEWQRYIVWAHGEKVRTWWDVRPGVEESESLALAIAGATGVSSGSAHTVPALLMPDRVRGHRLTDLGDFDVFEDGTLDGIACFHLQASDRVPQRDNAEEERHFEEIVRRTGRRPERVQSSTVSLWIDRERFLLRRVEEKTVFETFHAESVTKYDPAVDVSITDDELSFSAPA